MDSILNLVIILLYFFVKCESSNNFLPLFRILLDKTETCDIQVFHDGQNENVDWFGISMPVKVVQIPQDTEEPLQIDIFKARVLTSCKLVVFLSKFGISDSVIEKELSLEEWIQISSNGHLYYEENTQRVSVQSSHMIIAFAITEGNRIRLGQIYFWARHFFKITVLLVSHKDSFEICVWSPRIWEKLMSNYSSLQENLICSAEKPGTMRTSVFAAVKEISIPMPSWCYLDIIRMRANDLKIDGSSENERMLLKSHADKILHFIFLAANETLGLISGCSTLVPIVVVKSTPRALTYEITFVITENVGYQHLTCYRQEYLTFKLYVAPFKPLLWMTLAISIGLITAITTGYTYWKHLSFAPWLFLLATMFEEDVKVPRKSRGSWFIRLILGSWCFVSVVLTNCYTGVMISELNAPLKAVRPTQFRHLLCSRMSVADISKFLQSFKQNRIKYHNYDLGKGSVAGFS